MKIEIFVVKTAIEALTEEYDRRKVELRLENVKRALIKLFGGCTTIKACVGAWIDETGFLVEDSVEIWQIYVAKLEHVSKTALNAHLAYIRDATCQQKLAFAINNEIAFI